MLGVVADNVLAVFNAVTERHDIAIHAAAGLPWPPAPGIQEKIKSIDLTLFVTEWRDLMGGVKHPHWDDYRKIAPLAAKIEPWHWREAKERFLHRCRKYLPTIARAA